MKKWSQFLDSGTQSPIFGHLKMGTFQNVDLHTFVIKCRKCQFTYIWVKKFGQKSAGVKSLTNIMSDVTD